MDYKKALEFACIAHSGQVRKYTGEAYINHCIDVVDILKSHYVTEEAILMAAILHDTVEDTPVKFNEINKKFGHKVFHYVFYLTDVSRPEDGNREIRKQIDRWHIAHAPYEVHLIKCADLISNTKSIVQYDKDFAKIYLSEKRKLLETMIVYNTNLQATSIYQQAKLLSEQEL